MFWVSFLLSWAVTLFLLFTIFRIDLVYDMYYSFMNYGIFYYIMKDITIVVNVFEFGTHILVFMANANLITTRISGSKDEQEPLTFAMWNMLDIIGFVLLTIMFGRMNYWVYFLTFMHIGTGISGLIFPKTFQDYYIRIHFLNNPDWRKVMMRCARTAFTFLDAATRIYYVCKLFFLPYGIEID